MRVRAGRKALLIFCPHRTRCWRFETTYTSALMARGLVLCLAVFVLGAGMGAGAAAFGQGTPAALPADCPAYSSVPLPAEAEGFAAPKKSPACASYKSYRGIGRPVNYAQARACAWRERLAQQARLGQNEKEGTAWVVGGSLILADIYFNGAGVKRNIPLAMRFACEFEEQAAMLALPEVQRLNGSLPADGRFEFCDYAATTFTENFCTDYESEIKDDRRSRFYNALKSSMTPEQQAAFENLLKAKDAYIEAHASEVDQGGTIRNIRTIGSEEILEDLFHTEVVQFERKEWPKLSDQQVQKADSVLDDAYERKLAQLRTQTKEQIEEGAVTGGGLSSAEQAWKAYREAWVAFARLRYSSELGAVRAKITLDRYRLVKTISAYR